MSCNQASCHISVLALLCLQGYEPANTATARNQQSFFTPEMQQWLLDHATPLIDPGTGAMPRGGWPQIQAGFLDKFGVDKTTKALKSQYYILLRQGDKRTFTAGEVQAILDGVNKVLASEGKPAVKSLTTLTLMDVLRGRKMPDGSPLSLVRRHMSMHVFPVPTCSLCTALCKPETCNRASHAPVPCSKTWLGWLSACLTACYALLYSSPCAVCVAHGHVFCALHSAGHRYAHMDLQAGHKAVGCPSAAVSSHSIMDCFRMCVVCHAASWCTQRLLDIHADISAYKVQTCICCKVQGLYDGLFALLQTL